MGSPAQDGYEVALRWRDATRQYRDAIVTIGHALTSDAVGRDEALRLVATVVDSLRPLGDELFGPACPVAPAPMRAAHGDAVTCPLCDGEGVVDGLLVGHETVTETCRLCKGRGSVAAGAGAAHEAEWGRLHREVPPEQIATTRVTPAALWLVRGG